MFLAAFADVTTNRVLQLGANGVVIGSTYALAAVGFGLIVHIAHRFHIAYAAIFALTAFLVAQLQASYGLSFYPAMVIGSAIGMVIAVAIERLVYAPLAGRIDNRERSLFPVFVASLGLSTAIEALINVIWAQPITTMFDVSGITWGSVQLTNLTLQSVVVTWVAIGLVGAFLKWTRYGRMIRAVRVNPPLSLDFGIQPGAMYALVFAIGTALGGIGAVFLAAQSAPQSDMGESLVLYAITAAFIVGASRSPLVIAMLALAMGLIQSWSTLFISSAWSSFVIFAILLLFVLGKSLRSVNWARTLHRRPSPTAATPGSGSEPPRVPASSEDHGRSGLVAKR